jgi:hypothetical protein
MAADEPEINADNTLFSFACIRVHSRPSIFFLSLSARNLGGAKANPEGTENKAVEFSVP